MSPLSLRRMVVRIDPRLQEALTRIAERLVSETQLEYSRAAVFRGLVVIGIATVTQAPQLAPLFVGARVKRGRKPGGRQAAPKAPVEGEHAAGAKRVGEWMR